MSSPSAVAGVARVPGLAAARLALRGLTRAARQRSRWAFLRDGRWWLLGFAGLIGDAALRLMAPALLLGSALHGGAQWFWCVLGQPVLEEITFRGILQGELLRTGLGARRFGPLSVANLLCSVGFAALHFLHHPPLWAMSVFAPSLALGWLRERHGGVTAPTAMHALFNLTFFAAASFGGG